MTTTPEPAPAGPLDIGGQRFGRIVERHAHGGGPQGLTGLYIVRDDETGGTHGFDYTDIVTEGFRTIVTGERVRFLLDDRPDRARYVVRLDLPEVEAFYE